MFSHPSARAVYFAAILLVCPTVFAGEKPWTEVKSPNFRVLTDGSVGSGRRVAREFEQMRAVFEMGFPKMRLDTGAPLVIFAPRDETSMKQMAPAMWKGSGPKPAGFFQHGWERQYAVVRLDQDIPGKYQVVYHEYVHSLLHANFQWLPTWLDEGLAEYYGNTHFEENKMYVGAPSTRVYNLRGNTLIPLEELISENPWIKFRNNDRQIDMFYSEAWALVHYLVFGPGMEQGVKLSRFYVLLQKGVRQKKAFEEVFGNMQDLENALSQYTRKFLFPSYQMQNPPHIQEKDFPSRSLSVAETEAEFGTYRMWSHDLREARESIDQAIRDDVGLALPHETLGFLNFVEGKDSEAAAEFGKAYDADRQRYLSLYYKMMLSGLANSAAAPQQMTFRSAMYEVAKLNPRFAPVFIELAFVYLRQGDLLNALVMARKAESLEPTRAGYHLLSGRILLALGREQEAADVAGYVAERWRGPDHDEALELWNRISPEKRTNGAVLVEEVPADTKAAQGTLKSVTCGEKGQGMTVVIENADGALTFRNAGARRIGYSDTLWYGSDHFSPCHHLEGLRAVVRYKANADQTVAGDWVELELREDLPEFHGKKNETADSKKE
jgi:tetratricopeptide (TPR) repeat protein